MQPLREKLDSCLRMLDCGGSTPKSDIHWLNDFCATFLDFVSTLQKYICEEIIHESLETICLCLTQILICIRHLEYTIQTESTSGTRIQAGHQHFTDRIAVCLRRMIDCLSGSPQDAATESGSFVKILDSLLDTLSELTSENVDPPDPLPLIKQIKSGVDILLGQTLSFANVALQEDKRALSALCQKVMRDCGALKEECLRGCNNYTNQKLRAMTLEQALNQLEEFINESLLRLVYTCFLDFQKISVDKIRNLLRCPSSADMADEFIADFDVNLDRATQIGIFAIAFAPSLKVKTIVRSCLASFEYLDTSLIPSLQANASDLHSELLEQHFKEETSKFKRALQEIMDSRTFVGCYLQILTNCLASVEKQFDKAQLEDMVQMGFLIIEHSQLDGNRKEILQPGLEHLQNYVRILRECKAILMCASQVQPERIVKRFKILRNVLRKLHGNIGSEQNKPDEFTEKQTIPIPETISNCTEASNLNGLTTSPSRSILYNTPKKRSKEMLLEPQQSQFMKKKGQNCLRRKESLRTALFKRQNIFGSLNAHTTTENQSFSLEISEILNELTSLSNSFTKSQVGK